MSSADLLPAALGPYSLILSVILLFGDGALFGFAAKRWAIGVVFILVGILIAVFIGLSLPFGLSLPGVLGKVSGLIRFQAGHGASGIIYAFPVFWILGFALGLWKG